MNRGLKIGLFIAGALGVTIGAIVLYKYVSEPTDKITDRASAIEVFKKYKPDYNNSLINTGDEGYIVAWATALASKKKSFSFNGKKYSSSTGRAI